MKVAGNGPPVVFFHGAFGLQWDAFLDRLAQTHTVYAPEHPGTTPGAPDSIKPIDTLWDLVLYYYELLDELGLDAPAVVGHSFGGMVAAEVAATNPARVSKLEDAVREPVTLGRDADPHHREVAFEHRPGRGHYLLDAALAAEGCDGFTGP